MANRQIIVPAANILRLPFFVHRKTQSNGIEQNTNVQKQEPNQTKPIDNQQKVQFAKPKKKHTEAAKEREKKRAQT